jgi:hypothetical protein
VAELTGLLPDPTAGGWPAGMRVIVRRERPHPGAQLRFTDIDGWRFQAFATDTEAGQLAALEARHCTHATVEDRIRCGKHTGLGRFPSRMFAINAVWLELALTACDLIAWTQTILLHGELARCEPKALRYRLLHVAARTADAASSSVSPNTGHGGTNWPPRSPDSPPSRSRCAPDPPQTSLSAPRPENPEQRHEHAGTIRTPPNQIPGGNPTNKVINSPLRPLLKCRG